MSKARKRCFLLLRILHSRQDEIVPFHHAEDNFAAANEPKSLREIRGGHNDAMWSSHAVMVGAIREFLARTL
jgi:uncharacterized protein